MKKIFAIAALLLAVSCTRSEIPVPNMLLGSWVLEKWNRILLSEDIPIREREAFSNAHVVEAFELYENGTGLWGETPTHWERRNDSLVLDCDAFKIWKLKGERLSLWRDREDGQISVVMYFTRPAE